MSDQPTVGRRHGVPEGRSEYEERMIRTFYPDGTSVDSEPRRAVAGTSITWAGLAGIFSRINEPEGTRHVNLSRTVVTEATPWTEIVPDDPQQGVA
jgi:hypothetical protein